MDGPLLLGLEEGVDDLPRLEEVLAWSVVELVLGLVVDVIDPDDLLLSV